MSGGRSGLLPAREDVSSRPQSLLALPVNGLAAPLLLLSRGLVRVSEAAVSDCENNINPGR